MLLNEITKGVDPGALQHWEDRETTAIDYDKGRRQRQRQKYTHIHPEREKDRNSIKRVWRPSHQVRTLSCGGHSDQLANAAYRSGKMKTKNRPWNLMRIDL